MTKKSVFPLLLALLILSLTFTGCEMPFNDQDIAAPKNPPPIVTTVHSPQGTSKPLPNALPTDGKRQNVYVGESAGAHLYVRYAKHNDGGQPRVYEVVRGRTPEEAKPLIATQRAHNIIAYAHHVAVTDKAIVWLESELTPQGVLGSDWSLWCADIQGKHIRLLDESKRFTLKKGPFSDPMLHHFSLADGVVAYTTFKEKDGQVVQVVRLTRLADGSHIDVAEDDAYNTHWFSSPDTDGTHLVWSRSYTPDGIKEKGTTSIYNLETKKTVNLIGSDALVNPRIFGRHLIVRHLPNGRRLSVHDDVTIGSEIWHFDLEDKKWTWRLTGRNKELAAHRIVDFETPFLAGDWLIVRGTGGETASLPVHMTTGILHLIEAYQNSIVHTAFQHKKTRFVIEHRMDGRRTLSLDNPPPQTNTTAPS